VKKARKPSSSAARAGPASFKAQAFLDTVAANGTSGRYGRGETIYTQGGDAQHVMYIQSGGAITPSAVLLLGKTQMSRLLHTQHSMSDRFITHMLTRHIRIEEDLVDQLFNSAEKRRRSTARC
jgi:CRP-like cAMP-binding protein